MLKTLVLAFPKKFDPEMFSVMFTTKSKGQGFGLPVVKRMTESLGGMVTFETEEGKGTTFVVRLPLKLSHLNFNGKLWIGKRMLSIPGVAPIICAALLSNS